MNIYLILSEFYFTTFLVVTYGISGIIWEIYVFTQYISTINTDVSY